MNEESIADKDPTWAVAQIIHRLFQHLDDGEFEAVAGLFMPTGVWVRQGQELTGPDAVLKAMRARPAALSTRHLVTNMVAQGSCSIVDARYYATSFAHVGDEKPPTPLAGPEAIFVCEDRLVATAQGWRFLRRVPRLSFKRV